MAESEAVACFSFTSALAYSSPLGGAWLSDEKWGRFATICSLGSVYAVGLWLLVGAAATASAAGTAAALLLVGLGTGGIKPCVSSFGADQIGLGDADATRRYFALFYASINVGSTVSFLVTPAVRAFFGYAAAFALPAALLAAGLAVFVSGKNRYVRDAARDAGSRRRRGCLVDIPSRGDAAGASWIFRGCVAATPRARLDRPRPGRSDAADATRIVRRAV